MVFPPRKFTTVLDVARFAARMLDGTLDHQEILDKYAFYTDYEDSFKPYFSRRALPIEKATSREKGQPLCMSQYYRLLTSCRIPQKSRDKLFTKSHPVQGMEQNEHVIVACRNQVRNIRKLIKLSLITRSPICNIYFICIVFNNIPCSFIVYQ